MNELISFTENLLGIGNYSELVKFVTLLFVLMLIGIIFFFLFTLSTLTINQISKKYHAILHKRYSAWLIEYLLDPETQMPDAPLQHRRAFRNSILDLILITKGHEKGQLLKIYMNSGLWANDIDMLKNVLWHKRLAALVRLDQWQFCLGLENLSSLLTDDNFQIRQIAVKNLSRTKDPEEARDLLELVTKNKSHYSALYESIYRMIRIHRELVIDCLKDTNKKPLWSCIIKVIGDSRMIEAVPMLISIALESPETELREKALMALGQIGDPRGLGVLKEAIGARQPKERLAAVKSLFHLDFDSLKNAAPLLINDPDPDVRSWSNHLLKGGQ